MNDDVVSLLQRPDDSGSTKQPGPSPKQVSRLSTQCFTVLRTYEEIDRLEAAVLNGQEPVPQGGISKAAAAAAANFFAGIGIGADTISHWRFEFEQADGKFAPDMGAASGRASYSSTRRICSESSTSGW